MKKKFDKNDVLRFLYGELNEEEQNAFFDALTTDEELSATYDELSQSLDVLEDTSFEPSDISVGAVVAYVRTTSPAVVAEAEKRSVTSPRVRRFNFRKQVASAAMVIFAVGTVLFTLKAFSAPENANANGLTSAQYEWDTASFSEHLDHARMHLQNLSDDREVVAPVHHNTYRLINTNSFSPSDAGIVFLNIQ